MQLVIALKIPRKHGKKSSGRDLLYKLPPIHEKKKRTKRKEQITISLNSLLSQLKITLGGFKSHVECQETETCLAEEDKELFFPLPF